MQSKIFVDKDTTSAKEADCCINKTLDISSLTILQTNICTNEISKLFDTIKNPHSEETSRQNTDFVLLQV